MERRPYFLFGDLVSNVGVGALVGLTVASFVGETWSPVLGMVVGMLVGGALALPAALVLSVPFGAMEVMLPVMTTGMVSGMAVGMPTTWRSPRTKSWLSCKTRFSICRA